MDGRAVIPSDIQQHLGPFLGRQRWFAGSPEDADGARVVDHEWLADDEPRLLWLLVEAGGSPYQLPVGLRGLGGEEEVPEHSVLGVVADPAGGRDLVAFDALADPDCAARLLASFAAVEVTRSRAVGAEQSNSSVVFDDRVIMKLFRRPLEGPNPEVEMALALDEVGFNHVPAPLGHWRRDGRDLAIAQEFLAGGVEGWALALTSLRDLLAGDSLSAAMPPGDEPWAAAFPRNVDAAEQAALAGADFSPEAARLGEVTARMHVALAQAFGSSPGDSAAWAARTMELVDHLATRYGSGEAAARAARAARGSLDFPALQRGVGEVIAASSAGLAAGAAIRVHGDYHLGQVMRSEVGWFVLDFEGEPARSLEERRTPTSPLKDVAGMLRSFHYAAAAAVAERREEAARGAELAAAWEARNRGAFLRSYLGYDGLSGLLPPAEHLWELLRHFEIEKAIYELGYELAWRPEWAWVPLQAISRILSAPKGAGAESLGDQDVLFDVQEEEPPW